MRKSALLYLLLFICASGSPGALQGLAAKAVDPVAAIAEADALFDRWSGPFDFVAYEADLRGAIERWELALDGLAESDVQTRSHVLNRLAQAYFELATGYLYDNREKEAAFEAGKDVALASLRLDPTFDEVEAADGFRAALRSATDVAAIFWYGNTLGQWLNYHQFTAIMGGVKDVAASFERSLERGETYDGAGPHRAMGSLIAQAHFVIGRSQSEAAAHFERCIELAPNHLEARVSYVKDYLIPRGDAKTSQALLADVLGLGEDANVMAAFPFYNTLAIERARDLAGSDE